MTTLSAYLHIAGVLLAGGVMWAETAYYMAHQHRPGVSPHVIALSVAVLLGLVGNMLLHKEKGK
jgi:hypothetical protein